MARHIRTNTNLNTSKRAMSDILHPGTGIIFMKVGTHAKETLEVIIARKTEEIENAGFAFWGYGGNTCHPQTMVHPFARTYEQRGETVFLCMEEMESTHRGEPVRADEFSIDGTTWHPIPNAINALGSRFALVIRALRRQQLNLSLENTLVAVGDKRGRPGNQYIGGRVDKACLKILRASESTDQITPIRLVAELYPPYAVLLRNRA